MAVLLQHLEAVGLEGSPRFLGCGEQGRQVLTWIEGAVSAAPVWQQDDVENAVQLAWVAGLL